MKGRGTPLPLSRSRSRSYHVLHTESWVFMGRCGHTDPRILRSGSRAPTPKSAAAPMIHPTPHCRTPQSAPPPRAAPLCSLARARGLLWDLPGAGDGGTAGMGGGFWIGLDVCHGTLMGFHFHEGVRAVSAFSRRVSHILGRFPWGLCPRRGRTCGLSGLIQ